MKITPSFVFDWITIGKRWEIKTLVFLFLLFYLFGNPILVFVDYRESNIPIGYLHKIQSPMADTSQAAFLDTVSGEGEKSHIEKLTPRILPAFIAKSALWLHPNPYVAPFLGGIALLFCCIHVVNREVDDRQVAVWTGVIITGLYATSACWSNPDKPFDGIALGVISGGLLFHRNPFLLGVFAFASLWCDERAILSLLLIAFIPGAGDGMGFGPVLKKGLILTSSTVLYIITRILIADMFQWDGVATSQLAIDVLSKTVNVPQLSIWIAMEGAVLIAFSAIYTLWRKSTPAKALILLSLLLLVFFATSIVIDASRSVSFLYPAVLLLTIILFRQTEDREGAKKLLFCAAVVSLISPNMNAFATYYLPDVGIAPSQAILDLKHLMQFAIALFN